MAFATNFTLRAELRVHSPQGASCLAVDVCYEVDSDEEDIQTAAQEKMNELAELRVHLHRMLTECENGHSLRSGESEFHGHPRGHGTKASPHLPEEPGETGDRRNQDCQDESNAVAGQGSSGSDIDEKESLAQGAEISLCLSALEAAEGKATQNQVLQIRELLEKDNVSDEDFGTDLKRRYGKYYPEELNRLQASTILFEMRRREDFRSRELAAKSG